MHFHHHYLGIALSTATLFSLPSTPANAQSPVTDLQIPLASTLTTTTPFEIALDYRPPIDRNPKRTRGSGTRGSCNTTETWMRLLVPAGNYAEQTVSSYPVFSWYLTEASPVPLEFALVEEGGNEFLYSQRIENSPAGINQLQLPESAPALVPGKTYEWSITLICDEFDNAQNKFYYGRVKRVDPSEDLTEDPQLPTLRGSEPSYSQSPTYSGWGNSPQTPAPATPTPEPSSPWRESPEYRQVIQLAQDGQWYDALSNILAASATYPNDPLVQADLISLLEQGGLVDVAERIE